MKTDNCWLWARHIRKDGYGDVTYNGKKYLAHRFMYMVLVGEVPKGLELDHLCRTRHCINPDHLEPVTHLENIRRGDNNIVQKSKTHCAKGHPYDETNTYRAPFRPTKRLCKECRADYQRKLKGSVRRYKKKGERM